MLTKKKWALFSLLTLCGGTIYKLPSLKDAFYIPMQEYFHLTNGQIGNAMSVNPFVTTVGFFLSIYFADKLPRRYTMSFSLIATGLLGVYLTTMPGYWGILFVWALFGVTCDMMNWPVLLKSVSRLGNSEQQGRLFGFFETGRGIVDTVVAFSALAVFTWFGSGLLGFKAGIWFYSLKAIAEAVADYIPDGSTIFITIGTTVEHVARALLNHNHLRIITNSLRVAHILYHNPRFEVMVPGGTLRSHNSGIIGPSAASFVADFRADYLVTSVGAIESDGALMEFDVNEANVVKTMMAHARNILLVADHTKYHASAAVEIGNVAQVTALFTDELPPAALKSRLQDSQIEIILPQEDA